jgi:hypothetical protein
MVWLAAIIAILDILKVVAVPIWARWLLVLILIGGFAALFYRIRLRVRAARNSN